MVFDKPQDIAVIMTIFALIVAGAGLAITNFEDFGATVNSTFYTDINANMLSATGLKGTAEASVDVLEGLNGSTEQTNTENIIQEGFSGMINLGTTWGLMWSELNNAIRILGIPSIFITLVSGLIAISFVVVLYTWIRSQT
jgi:hypothetical protein